MITSLPIIFQDNPGTTSPVTYKVQGIVTGGSLFINRNSSDTDLVGNSRTISTIELQEIRVI